MRTLIFLLFPVFLTAQIDTKDIVLTSDSTITTRPDTAYWKFNTGIAKFTRPNGTTKDIEVYEARLVIWQSGKRTTPITSGILMKKEYLEFLSQYRDQHNSEIDIIVKALSGVRDRRDQLANEIQSARSK